MKIFLVLFFTFCFPLVIFLTTILYSTDLTSILKSDLIKNHLYNQLSDQLAQLDTGDENSALINQFIHNKFTSHYIQKKVEKALNDSDDWIKGKTTKPPELSFTDVRDEINAQYPQLLPSLVQAAQEMKQQEAQNPDMQQNPDAAKNLDMIASLAKSDFTIPLNKYLVSLKNFYTTVRILQPILVILLILSLIWLGFLNKTWPGRLKWIGIALLFGSIWGFILAYGNVETVTLLAKYMTTSSNHALQVSSPILLQLINQYVDAFASNQKTASIVALCVAVGCFIFLVIANNRPSTQAKPVRVAKKK